MSDRELLRQLAAVLNRQMFVIGDGGTINDMVTRYKFPPFTRAYPIAMRMNKADFKQLRQLLDTVADHLKPTAQAEERELVEYDDH